MYADNIKKLHDDLSKLIFVKDDIETADADKQGCGLQNLMSIMEKYIHSNIWSMDSFEFKNQFGEWEEKDPKDVFWPYTDNLVQMKRKLTFDHNKLRRIYKKVQEELKFSII